MKKLSIFFSILMILALAFTFKPAQAATEYWLQFAPCTYNNSGSTAIGLEQLWIKVTKADDTHALFTFYNVGPDASSITDIYFADGTLLGISDIIEPAGVDFTLNATPGWLPGANGCDPAFTVVTVGFSADSNSPITENGVNNGPPPPDGEYVGIEFQLMTGKVWEDVVAELVDGTLRIGVHVQGFDGGYSESFATNAYTAVELMSFNASARAGNVTVKWATGTELNNAGFNLYRSSSELGTRTRLTNNLIAARGDAVSGGSYSFTDAPGYGTFFYWLEDVELGGTASLHGPVVVTAWPSIRLPVSRPAVP